MVILGIETSCDETAAAVLLADESGRLRIASNIVSSQIKLHAQYGGVVPALAAREHVAHINGVVEQALADAQTSIQDVDLIAVTSGPGLGPALMVGLAYTKTVAWKFGKPVIGVNHLDGHVHANWINGEQTTAELDVFPALNVLVSGGHTELVLMRDHGDYEIVGETLDDAIGEAFDKAARLLGLGYPGGPAISKLATSGTDTAYALPRPLSTADNCDVSYSGLKTALLYLVRNLEKETGPLTEQQKADLAASFQEAAIDTITRKAERAAKEYGVHALLLSGGVSANTVLRERLATLADTLGIAYRCPAMAYTTDNAAMIAVAGYFAFQKHKEPSPDKPLSWNNLTMNPNAHL